MCCPRQSALVPSVPAGKAQRSRMTASVPTMKENRTLKRLTSCYQILSLLRHNRWPWQPSSPPHPWDISLSRSPGPLNGRSPTRLLLAVFFPNFTGDRLRHHLRAMIPTAAYPKQRLSFRVAPRVQTSVGQNPKRSSSSGRGLPKLPSTICPQGTISWGL